MRNFTASNTLSFVTYNVNGGEYCRDADFFGELVSAIADAFESPLSLVHRAFTDALCDQEFIEYLAPSEYAVVKEFCAFGLWVASSDERTQSRVCSYHNLNTGKSVIWAHVVI
jgi:hypothetical protein